MNKVFASIFAAAFTLGLSACSGQLPVRPNSLQAQSAPQTADQSRIMETFKGYLNHSQYDSSGMAEMLMSVKSLLGSTYDNRNSAGRYYLYLGSGDSLATVGTIRLGRDKVLYLESLDFSNNQKRMLYYRLGTFQLAAGSKDGQDVSFTLDRDTSLKMKWRGINPMNHDEIHLTLSRPVQPIEKDKSAFF